MYLVEGARAAWILEPVQHVANEPEVRPITWIPRGPEQILADALVMIAGLVVEDEKVQTLLGRLPPSKSSKPPLDGDWFDLTEFETEALERLEESALNAIPPECKLIVTSMSGSSIYGQLGLLEDGAMDAEVCTVTWMRGRDFDGNVSTAGELPPDDPESHRFTALRI
jgi:hypothetical protein